MDFRLLITVFISLLTLYSTSLSAKDNFNLDFEEVEEGAPKRWHKFDEKNSYRLVIDSTNAVSGKNSIAIEHSGEKPWAGGWRYTIPAKYKGKKITLKGFIKTTDVTDGWAGLWISVKPKISYNNMKSYGVTGTTEWKLYEVDATLGEEASSIDFGGWLVGKGKAWFDKFELLIDDKPIHEAPTRIPPKEALALSDKEFDNGSYLSLEMLNNVTPNELSTLGKIWGFLKYYHPAIAKGNYNWDYELFRFLPKYINSDTSKKRNNVLIKWIDNLGEIDLCSNCLKSKKNAVLKPDLN